jgi:predicted HicB family RNase H-like nuclease
MNIMNYQGYAARIEYSDEDQLLIGHVAGIRDVIGFHATCVAQLRKAFEEAVDDYLETCRKLGREPQKAYSGKLSLRLESGLHATVAAQAELAHKSINQWVCDALSLAIRQPAS